MSNSIVITRMFAESGFQVRTVTNWIKAGELSLNAYKFTTSKRKFVK